MVVVVLLLLALLESRSGEERKLETRSPYTSGVAAVLDEDAVVAEACFDCGISWLKFSPLEDGADREGIFLLLECALLCTDEVLAGFTGPPDGVFEGAGAGIRRPRSEAPGSFFIFTRSAAALGKSGVYGGFIEAA